MNGRQKIFSNGSIKTLLGWCLMGKFPDDMDFESIRMTITSLLLENLKMEDLCNFDVLGITDPSEKKIANELQEAAKQHFFDPAKVENGYFSVHMNGELKWIYELKLPGHYLTHRLTIKENSTTRIRPVFDASKQKGSSSLNDC